MGAFLLWSKYSLHVLLERLGVPKSMIMPLVKAVPVLAIVVTTALSAGLNFADKGVAIVGHIPAGLLHFTWLSLDVVAVKTLIMPAVLISIIGYVESMSVGKILAARVR